MYIIIMNVTVTCQLRTSKNTIYSMHDTTNAIQIIHMHLSCCYNQQVNHSVLQHLSSTRVPAGISPNDNAIGQHKVNIIFNKQKCLSTEYFSSNLLARIIALEMYTTIQKV